jgi:hypothetical protein
MRKKILFKEGNIDGYCWKEMKRNKGQVLFRQRQIPPSNEIILFSSLPKLLVFRLSYKEILTQAAPSKTGKMFIIKSLMDLS